MPTLNATKTRITDFVQTEVYPVIAARQENFARNKDRYWQAGETHTSPPPHVSARYNDRLADQLDSGPGDEVERWSNVFPLWSSDAIPCSLRVDTYSGPNGDGWVLVYSFQFNGRLFVASINTGPESDRTSDWQEIEPGL